MDYKCIACNYFTKKHNHWCRHLKTKKHLSKNVYLCECGKEFKHQSGICRHKNRKCDYFNTDEEINPNSYVKQLIEAHKETQEQNTILINKVVELSKERKVVNYNNQMTINVFLNDKCGDAMNLTDFIDKLKISLEDLSYTKDNGLVNGISNIFAKQLEDMKPTERPIHCSDKKRMQFYIRESDKWEKDKQHIKLDKSIENVITKQIKKIKIWEKEHPNFMANDKLVMEWNTMIHNSIADEDNKEIIDIKKKIVSSVEIDKSLLVD